MSPETKYVMMHVPEFYVHCLVLKIIKNRRPINKNKKSVKRPYIYNITGNVVNHRFCWTSLS